MPGRTNHHPRGARRARQRGFSLLEVVIALAIAGIALAAVFQAAATSMRATAAAAVYQEAISRARSHLDSLTTHPAEGDHEGDDGGGYRWRHLVRPASSNGKRDELGRPVTDTDALVVTLYEVTVWITWRDGTNARTVRLDSAALRTTAPS